MSLLRLVSVPVLGFLASSATAQDVLVHVGSVPEYLLVDPATMSYDAVLSIGTPSPLQSFGYFGQGVFYGLTGFPASVSVVRIDMRTPLASVVGNTNMSWTDFGCGVDPSTGSMYVIGVPQPGFPPANLYSVNLQTGALTLIGPTNPGVPGRSFTIDAQGQGWSVTGYGTSPQLPFHPRLWTVDLATGQTAIAASFDSVNLTGGLHSAAVRSDGSVWLATDHGLWKLDPTTLTGTQLTSNAAWTIAFAPASEIGLGYTSGCHGNQVACPCPYYFGQNGNGCPNSTVNLGGNLRAFGAASLSNDTLRLVAANLSNSTGLFFQGNATFAPIPFGEGLRCTGGVIRRLGGGVITNNAFSYPGAAQLPVSVRGQITSPGTFHYQALYRDSATFCNGSAFNLTNSVSVIWIP